MPLRTPSPADLRELPFPTLTVGQLAAIIARHGLEASADLVTRLPTIGMVNTVFALGPRHVLRVPKETEDGFADAYTESVSVPAAIAAGVRTPALVAFDSSGDLLDVPYTIYERVEGENFALASVDRDEVYRQLGRDLAHLHRNVVECADPHGYLDEPERTVPVELLERLGTQGFIGPENIRWLETVFARLAPAVEEAASFRRFLHDDAQPSNIVVDAEGAYAALLDWGDAGWGDPALELSWVPSRAVPSVLRGYREVGPIDGDESAEARILWDHLGLALEWLGEPAEPATVAWDATPGSRMTELLSAAVQFKPWRELLSR